MPGLVLDRRQRDALRGEAAESLENIGAIATAIRAGRWEHARGLREQFNAVMRLLDDLGSSKELLETVLKNILGLHGVGPETRLDIPQLVKQANVDLGLDAAEVRGDGATARYQRKLLGSLATIVNSAAELRNAGFGTGHGISQRPELDVATARLVVSAAVAVATFYIEAHAEIEPER